MKGGGLVTWGTLLLAAPSLVRPAGGFITQESKEAVARVGLGAADVGPS